MADALWLPAFFSTDMVLQRNTPVRIWGRARPGAAVEVAFTHHRATAVTGEDGAWKAELPPLREGGPYDLTVSSEWEIKRISNVAVGDVWLCSGQSNMEWTIASLRPEHRPQNQKSLPMLRLFTVERNQSAKPLSDVKGTWNDADAESILPFSAVAFYFGRKLHEELGVPIGLISSAWGGTLAEAWTPREALAGDAILARHVENLPTVDADIAAAQPHADPGNTGGPAGWAKGDHDTADWKPMPLPGIWQNNGIDTNGSVWFRLEVTLPNAWVGRKLKLSLGPIDDFDTTYFNGHEVGAIGEETANWWVHPRVYTVPADFVRVGRNVIAVRVFDRWGNGGFAGAAADMTLAPADGSAPPIPLAGEWLSRVEHALPPMNLSQAVANTSLYNGMIHPLVGYAIAGAIWYQGESNAPRGWEYRPLLAAMIRAWRAAWGQGDYPFLIVQLAGFGQPDSSARSPWAEIRESQRLVSETEPNAGLAVATDLGEELDIHPQNKRDVGLRLADEALRIAYGRTNIAQAPRMARHRIKGDTVVIDFDRGGPLRADGPVLGVDIAGDDGVYHHANATVEGSTLRVRSPNVAKPASVRYAWRGHSPANLRGATGLPALPFRTDDGPWTTENAR